MSLFVSQTLKFFFLLTPFFGLSMFISMTTNYSPYARRILAVRVALAAIVIGLVLFFFGSVGAGSESSCVSRRSSSRPSPRR